MKVLVFLVLVSLNRLVLFINKYFKYIITFSVLILTIILSATILKESYFRLYHSVKDIFISFGYSFCEINIEHNIKPTVLSLPSMSKGDSVPITPPMESLDYSKLFIIFFTKFFNATNLVKYMMSIGLHTLVVLQFTMIISFAVTGIVVYRKFKIKTVIVNPEKETKVYHKFIKIYDKVYIPMRDKIKETVNFILGNNYIKTYLILWFFVTFNILTILFEFLAYYIYLTGSLKLTTTINFQFYKLLYDLNIYFRNIPILIHIILAYLIFIN